VVNGQVMAPVMGLYNIAAAFPQSSNCLLNSSVHCSGNGLSVSGTDELVRLRKQIGSVPVVLCGVGDEGLKSLKGGLGNVRF